MEWQQILVIIGSNFAMLLGLLGTTIALYIHGSNQGKEQGARTDKLYQMFIDLLKEGKK